MGGINVIQENYVSFEIAKLLKERGFNEPCIGFYSTDGNFFGESAYRNNWIPEINGSINAPTLQMAMKWLREVHNLHIDIDPSEGDWNPTILELEDWTCAVKFNDKIPIQDSYEEACEAAIKYCLESLIH